MLRVATKLGRSAALPEGAWQGAWKQLFTPQTTSQRYASTVRGAPSRGVWKHSKTRPGFFRSNATSQGGYRWAAPKRGFRFTAWRRNTSNEAPKAEKLSLGARLKQMSKEYGWTAVGVYLTLSALDFPFCFLFVRTVGTEKIGKIEHQVVETFKSVVPESVRTKFLDLWASFKKTETKTMGNENISGTVEMASWGVKKADAANTEEASLATQLALAYAIHKSFIFIRVPLTAAILPKVVKVLRSWGWKVGKATPKV